MKVYIIREHGDHFRDNEVVEGVYASKEAALMACPEGEEVIDLASDDPSAWFSVSWRPKRREK
jgi:hypothetical protein